MAAWCAPLFFLAAVVAGAWIVLARPFALFAWALGALAAVPIGWVLVSVLWPAKAERRCHACGRGALTRLDARTTIGVVCRTCGWRDEAASAWLLAEEDGPLEDIVLAQRGRARLPGAVDSSRPRG